MQRSIKSKEEYKDFSAKQMKGKLDLLLTSVDSAAKGFIDFFKFIDWVMLSMFRSVRNFINAFRKFSPIASIKKSLYLLNKFITNSFPAEKALLNFSILFVLAIASNPWLSSSLFDQHFYAFSFKLFSDIIFAVASLGATVNFYSFVNREFRRFKAKQLKEYHQRLLEREKACRRKPVKNLHSLNR